VSTKTTVAEWKQMIANMPPALTALEQTYNPETGTFGTDNCSTEQPVCHMWYWLLRMTGARQVLETGTFRGYSTCFLAAAVRDNGGGRVTTVDPWVLPHLWDDSELAQFITWLPLTSAQAAESIRTQTFDVLVIDSEHTYRTVATELRLFEPLLREGGLILLHDSLFHDGVGLAIRDLYETGRFEHITLDTPRALQTPNIPAPVSMGCTVMRKQRPGNPIEPQSDLLPIPEHVPDGPKPVLRR
jgi:predicted O-methyltransferase YrrM